MSLMTHAQMVQCQKQLNKLSGIKKNLWIADGQYLKNNPMFKATEINNQVQMRTSIFRAFTLFDSLLSFNCEAVQPINTLNLSPLVLILKLFQALQLSTLLPRDLYENKPHYREKDLTIS